MNTLTRPSKKITEKQEQTLRFLVSFFLEEQYIPTYRDVALYFQITVKSAWDRTTALVKKGYLDDTKERLRFTDKILTIDPSYSERFRGITLCNISGSVRRKVNRRTNTEPLSPEKIEEDRTRRRNQRREQAALLQPEKVDTTEKAPETCQQVQPELELPKPSPAKLQQVESVKTESPSQLRRPLLTPPLQRPNWAWTKK